jgi:hypothetical protein
VDLAPDGAQEVCSLQRWLSDNVWEGEDGPTKVVLCQRAYYWDHGMCWIDNNRVAIGGTGTDDELMIAGVRVFDLAAEPRVRGRWRDAAESHSFAGPKGELFSDGTRLFSSDENGLTIWDVSSGARLGLIEGFVPTRYHRVSGELAAYQSEDRRFSSWSLPP